MVGSNLLKPSNELLANFDYKDLIRGNAYVTYYAGSAFNSGATESPVLFVETFRSKEETNNVSLAKSLSNAVRIDEDYDIKVAQTQIMKGSTLNERRSSGLSIQNVAPYSADAKNQSQENAAKAIGLQGK